MLEDTFLSDLYNVTPYSYNDFHKMEVVEYFCIPVFDIREPSSYQVVTDVVVPFFGAHFTPDDRVAWAIETRKLSGLCVFDMDYFEEFLQKNCPIAYGLVDTYILLRELQELTPTTKVF